MTELFECKVKYRKVTDSGIEKTVTEPYLLTAISFTDAESKIHNEMEAFISGEFIVQAIKRANYSEIIKTDGDTWYKGKVTHLSIDEEAGREKKVSSYVLVGADNVDKAFSNINEAFSDMVVDYTIEGIHDSKIMDFFE